MLWFHCQTLSNGNGHVYVRPQSRKEKKQPCERTQNGLQPVGNLSETNSGSPSQTLCSFGYSIIALYCFFVALKMLILYVLVSASFPETGQNPVSTPKGSKTGLKLPLPAHWKSLYLCLFGYSTIALELQEKFVDCVLWFHYWTTSKHLRAQHLRLHIVFLQNLFLVNFFMPVFLWNHARKKNPFQNSKSD